MFRKVLDSATAGDNVGVLLEGLSKEQLHEGDLLQG
jgi:translation elongation factor EF-Tu-like GTPase